MRKPGDNILQENLFIMFSSTRLVATSRLFYIIFHCIIAPVRIIASSYHKLARYGWNVHSYGQVIDTLETKLKEIEKNSMLICSEDFMMKIFDKYEDELPPLKDYQLHLYEKKTMLAVKTKLKNDRNGVIVNTTEAETPTPTQKLLPLFMLKEELFHPKRKTSKETQCYMNDLGRIAAEAMLAELRDPKKAMHSYLSSANGNKSWHNVSDSDKSAGLMIQAINNPAESFFGELTNELQVYTTVKLQHAGGVDQI